MSTQIKYKECCEAIDEKEKAYRAKVDGDLTPEIRTELDTMLEEIRALKADKLLLEEGLKMENPEARNLPVNLSLSNRPKEEIKRFSLRKFLTEASNQKLTGFEAEMDQEARSETRDALKETVASGISPNGFGIPQDVMDMMRTNIAYAKAFKRAQSTTVTEGGYGIQTDVNSIIEPLYPNPIVVGMGATVFDNLVGNQSWPKDTNLFSFAFESETGESDDTSKTFAQVTLSPKRLAGRADISRRLLAQEKSRGMQAYLESEFIKGVDVAVDIAAVNGSGATNNPTGILNVLTVPQVIMGANGAVPTWQKMLDFPKSLDQSNAAKGTLGYLTTPEIKSILMSTLKNTTYGTTGYIWETNDTVAGYKAAVSNSMPSGITFGSSNLCHSIIFGNWADLLIGKWGGTFVLVDPFTQMTTSQVRIHCELQMDVIVRRSESFAVSKSALNGLGS